MEEPLSDDLRVCFIGDSIVLGTGDDELVGWPGRLCRSIRKPPITVYNLGVRGDTSADVLRRWRAEATWRLPRERRSGGVFGFGLNDCFNDRLRWEAAVGLVVERARRIMHDATLLFPSMFVGPAPVDEERGLACGSLESVDRGLNGRIEYLNVELKEAARLDGFPYLDVFFSLQRDSKWRDAVGSGDGVHPVGAGYELLAHRVSRWQPWLGLLDPATSLRAEGLSNRQ
jgi:lysophospholipase L1-like esterase